MARATRQRQPAAATPERPNERGLRLLRGIAEGCSNESLAEETGLTVQTVKNCVSEMLEKYRVANRTALVTLALQMGWFEVNTLRVRRT